MIKYMYKYTKPDLKKKEKKEQLRKYMYFILFPASALHYMLLFRSVI